MGSADKQMDSSMIPQSHVAGGHRETKAEGTKRKRLGNEANASAAAAIPEHYGYVASRTDDDRSKCKGCRSKIEFGDTRIGRLAKSRDPGAVSAQATPHRQHIPGGCLKDCLCVSAAAHVVRHGVWLPRAQRSKGSVRHPPAIWLPLPAHGRAGGARGAISGPFPTTFLVFYRVFGLILDSILAAHFPPFS